MSILARVKRFFIKPTQTHPVPECFGKYNENLYWERDCISCPHDWVCEDFTNAEKTDEIGRHAL